jgi:hypothetical protein
LRKTSQRPAAALGAALLLLAAVLAACGGGSGEDTSKVLDQTFASAQKVNSGRLTLDASAKLEGLAQLSGPVAVKMSGPFEGLDEKIADTGRIPRTDLDISTGVAGQTFRAGFASTGDKLYVNFRGTDYLVPDSQFRRLKQQLAQSQAQDAKTKTPDLAALGIRPRNWLKDAKDKGTETIGGAETIHIRGGVDIGKMLQDFDRLLKRAGELNLSKQQLSQLPQGIPSSAKDQIKNAVKKAELDIYTGKDDKVLRKLDARIDFEVPPNLRQQAGGLSRGEVKISLAIADVNKPQTITAPRSAKPLSALRSELSRSGFGALGGQGGTGSGSGSQSTTPGSGGNVSPSQSRRYLKCVQKAKGTAALNRCSKLLR